MRRILLVFVASALACVPLSAEEPMEKESTVSVQGEAEIFARPDLATVTLGVAQTAATADQAQSRVNEKMQAVMGALRDLAVPEHAIRTVGVNLSPTYPPASRGETPVITGYRASNTVSIRIDKLELVGPVLDAATRVGGNEIQGIQFDLKDDSEIRQTALAQATKKAYAKAGVMAEALGLKLGRVIELSESSSPVRPLYQQARVMSEAAAPVSVGQVTVTASVILRCALEK